MACEHYQNALIERAASGAEPQGELRAHLANCAACRTAFFREQSLFSSMDEGLHAVANPEVPASLLPRVRARVADEPAPLLSWRFPSFVLAGAVAIVVAFLVVRTAWYTNVEQPPSNIASDSTRSSTAKEVRQAQNSNAGPPLTGKSAAHPQDAATRTPARPTSPATRDSIPQVLVPPDQEVLLVSYAEEWNRRKRLPLVAENFNATNLSPLQIAPIRISQLDVKLMEEEQAQ
jgi:anti-sigma factor RsiW